MMMASSSDDRSPFWIQRFRSSENDIRRRAVIVASAVMLALATLLMALYICINLRRCRRRRRSAFTAGGLGGAHPEDSASPGLDPAAIQRLPVTVIPAKMESRDYAEAQMTLTECSICISELRGGHDARVLPACWHVFHVECIDTWLLSHSTCPLCRNAVVVPTDPTPPPPPTVSADRSPASTSVSASAAASMSVPADVAIDVGADVAVVGPPEGGETRQPSLSSSSGRWGVGRIVSRDRNGGSGRVYPEPYVAAHDSSLHSDVAAHDSSTSSP